MPPPSLVDAQKSFSSSQTSITLNKRLDKFIGDKKDNLSNKGSLTSFLDYTFKTTKDLMDTYGITYFSKFKNVIDVITKEENMIPAGVLLIIISMGLYFIDITS